MRRDDVNITEHAAENKEPFILATNKLRLSVY